MPKETFFNLPEEKRGRILAAAAEEVIRVPLSQVSINQIIQKAEISRGSFYQYFDDKQDLVEYMLSDYINMLLKGVRETLMNVEGNLFDTAVVVFDGVIALAGDEKSQKGMKHVICDIIEKKYSINFLLNLEDELIKILSDGADRSRLREDSEEMAVLTAKLVFMVLKSATVECLCNFDRAVQVKDELKKQLEIIRYGAEKEKIDVKI